MESERLAGIFRGVLGALCALAVSIPASARAESAALFAEIPHTQPPPGGAERLLAVHNMERTRLGLPPLSWNASLARDAADYAKRLLTRGRLEHASRQDRKGHGENLWMGAAGVWNGEAMVGMFLDERRNFRAAAFPDVSSTGNWADVGHYTQMVWRDTKEVGCAIETGRGADVLVCRYFPAGNVMGTIPY